MSSIKSGDRCADCKHCKIWSVDHKKATCTLYDEQGFHPDRPVPRKCVGNVGEIEGQVVNVECTQESLGENLLSGL